MAQIYLKQKCLCKTKKVRGLGAVRGLMFRRRLPKGETLLLELPKRKVEIHSWFMFFPIDLFFLDEKFCVVEKVYLTPWKIYLPKKPAKYLLEANKGEFEIGIGEKLALV